MVVMMLTTMMMRIRRRLPRIRMRMLCLLKLLLPWDVLLNSAWPGSAQEAGWSGYEAAQPQGRAREARVVTVKQLRPSAVVHMSVHTDVSRFCLYVCLYFCMHNLYIYMYIYIYINVYVRTSMSCDRTIYLSTYLPSYSIYWRI